MGINALATKTLNTLPKLELAVIFKYFKILPNTLRPSITASFKTVKLFSSKITELASFVMSAAVSTEIPTSAFLSAGASLIPSPRKPTVCPAFSANQ